jgi:hypothetical protein
VAVFAFFGGQNTSSHRERLRERLGGLVKVAGQLGIAVLLEYRKHGSLGGGLAVGMGG